MTAIPATVRTTLEDARLAAEAEGVFVPTAAEMDAIKRIRVIDARIARDKEERETLVDALKASMLERDAKKLAVDGKNVAQYIDRSTTVVDTDALKAAAPTVVALYEDAKQAFEIAAARFTSRKSIPFAAFKVS